MGNSPENPRKPAKPDRQKLTEGYGTENRTGRDLVIGGYGSAGGGAFANVKVSGKGIVNGDIDCNRFEVSGYSDVQGSVKAHTFKVSGEAVVQGSLDGDSVNASGKLEVSGDVAAKELRVSGLAMVKGGLTAEETEIRGHLTVKGDCAAEVFIAKGSFNIGGLLNGGKIDVFLHGDCRVKEIGGETIRVRREVHVPVFSSLSKVFHAVVNHRDGLEAESIEGDDVYLEYAKAKVVRGNNVNIGPGCTIELVEYNNSFEQDKGAEVKEHKKA